MEFRQIRYALAVAKERSFSKGAARSNVSQSAVSEQVKLLEEEIGFALFRRTSRGIEVTERGRSFLQEAQKIFNDMINLSDTASRLRGEVSDTFTMGMASGVDQILIPRLFKNVDPLKSRMRLAVVTAPTRRIFDDLYEERIDAGVAIESDPARVPAGLRFERLAAVELVLIAHPKHQLSRSRKPIDIASLAGEPLVMSELTIGYGEIVLSMFASLGLKPNVFAVADNIATMKSIIQLGKGVAIVPQPCVTNEVTLGLLRAFVITPKRDAVFSLIRGRQPLSQRKENFIETLRESLRD